MCMGCGRLEMGWLHGRGARYGRSRFEVERGECGQGGYSRVVARNQRAGRGNLEGLETTGYDFRAGPLCKPGRIRVIRDLLIV